MSDSCASGQAGVLPLSPQQAPGPLQQPLELVFSQHNFPLYHFLPKDAVVARIIHTALTSLPERVFIKGCYMHRCYCWPGKFPKAEATQQDHATPESLAVWEQFRAPKHAADFHRGLTSFQSPHLESLPNT